MVSSSWTYKCESHRRCIPGCSLWWCYLKPWEWVRSPKKAMEIKERHQNNLRWEGKGQQRRLSNSIWWSWRKSRRWWKPREKSIQDRGRDRLWQILLETVCHRIVSRHWVDICFSRGVDRDGLLFLLQYMHILSHRTNLSQVTWVLGADLLVWWHGLPSDIAKSGFRGVQESRSRHRGTETRMWRSRAITGQPLWEGLP